MINECNTLLNIGYSDIENVVKAQIAGATEDAFKLAELATEEAFIVATKHCNYLVVKEETVKALADVEYNPAENLVYNGYVIFIFHQSYADYVLTSRLRSAVDFSDLHFSETVEIAGKAEKFIDLRQGGSIEY